MTKKYYEAKISMKIYSGFFATVLGCGKELSMIVIKMVIVATLNGGNGNQLLNGSTYWLHEWQDV